MDDFPENWVDDIGQKVDADILNLLGAIVNALKGNKFKTWTQTEYDAIAVKDPDVLYVVTED